ncbi:hypothetical protein AXF42_Ash014958 [Apostasia shenzhenica]|uniref:Retrotransposon gag domain-containing protein n=1 Tax=Apostasia shenzhenica TaxID=1088818 RepID=A0A2I0ALN2_9ASPA|nr:hypothetical protein AXF42_Ash014958 [Apostasia shenzhenica]
MVARLRRTNSTTHSAQIAELREMLANLTDLVIDIATRQAVVLQQTRAANASANAAFPLISAVPAPLPPVTAASALFPPIVAARHLSPPVVVTPALFLLFAASTSPRFQRGAPLTSRTPSAQASGSSHLPCQDFPHQGPPQYGPEAFFGPFDFDAAFSDAIRQAPVPEEFKLSRLEVYKGTTDSRKHIQGFETALRYRQKDETMKCHLLATTLKGAAFTWFIKLPKGSINSYEHMKQELITRFIGGIRMALSDMVLANIQQGETESLRSYTNRFFAIAAETEDINPTVAIHNYRRGLFSGDLSKSLQLVKLKSFLELMARAS